MMKKIFTFFTFLVLIASCQKDEMESPFTDVVQNQDTVGIIITDPEPASFAGIYQNVFRPTCANVGCHDGTFEPDFRTMESAYNTLLFQTPIKNNGSYQYRVEPYNVQGSVIIGRLEDAISPPMPIQIEPDSDWPEKSAEYIGHIKAWIGNGAPDITGQLPQIDVIPPKAIGLVFIDHTNGDTIRRADQSGPLQLPDSATDVSIYVAFESDTINPMTFTHNVLKISSDITNFDQAMELSLEVLPTPELYLDYSKQMVPYTHRVRINPSTTFNSGASQYFFRTYVEYNGEGITETPNQNAIFFIKNYMSFVWNS